MFATRTITGVVTSNDKITPLQGVMVKALNNNAATFTDYEGKYKIEVDEGVNQLEFFILGYKKQYCNIEYSLICNLSLESYIPEQEKYNSTDTSAIESAVDTVYTAGGGTVYIPSGTFNLDGSVLIPNTVNLTGAGIGNTIIYTHGESEMITVQDAYNVRISSFSLISENYDGMRGINVIDCVDFRIYNLHIEGYWHAGIWSKGLNRGVIDHCFFKARTGGIADGYGYGVVGWLHPWHCCCR